MKNKKLLFYLFVLKYLKNGQVVYLYLNYVSQHKSCIRVLNTLKILIRLSIASNY